MTQEKTTIELIEEKLKEVKHKKVLARFLAAKFKNSPRSVYNNWICEGFVPEKHQVEVLEYITNYLIKADK